MDTPIVRIENLSHRYSVQWAVRDINLEIRQHGIYGLLGSNGAGKSTIMNIMCGVLKQTEGDIYIKGINTRIDPVEAKCHIGFLPQQPPLHPDLTVEEYLDYSARLRYIPHKEIPAAITEVVEKCGISHFRKRLIRNLSGGYQQRVGIAQALIHDPEVVILDEPTTGLDPNQIFGIRKIIKEIGEEKTVILSSHILSEIETTCDQVMIMSNGKIVANGTTSELRRKSDAEYCLKIGIKGGETTDIHEALNDLPGVLHIEIIHKQNFELQCKPDIEIEKSIFNLCQKNNWYISELTPVQTRLEDIFRKVTQNE